MSTPNNKQLVVMGATIQGFAQACVNLNIVAGRQVAELTEGLEVMEFYPFERLRALERTVVHAYDDSAAILEQVGQMMMMGWYHHGPGQQIIKSGVDFLRFQSGSQGYASVVLGPETEVGAFRLESLDDASGKAVIHSTTPFEKNLERGVIIGGMSAPGDLDYIDIDNSKDPHYFHIEFH